MSLMPGQEQVKDEPSELLASITGVDSEIAGLMLRKHNGDLEMAADTLLAEGWADIWTTWNGTTPEPPEYVDDRNNSTSSSLPARPSLPSTSAIAPTNKDAEMDLAIQISMQESSQHTNFGPSERQMAPVTGFRAVTAAHEYSTLNETFQAGLQGLNRDTDVSPFRETIRERGRPIALRTNTSALAYAALVVQALYFVPQVRATVSNLRLPKVNPETAPDHPGRSIWNLIELFTNMDLAQHSATIDSELLPSMEIPHFDGTKPLGDASSSVVKNVAHVIEQRLEAQAGENEEPDRLFTFTHAGNRLSRRTKGTDTGAVVVVEFGQDLPHNDLNYCISDILTGFATKMSYHEVIIKPSDVITFELKRLPVGPSDGSVPLNPFSYPKTIYLDQFLFQNIGLVNSKRKLQLEMLGKIEELKAYRESLTLSEGHETLRNLQSTIHHYENLVNHNDYPVSEETLQAIVDHLKDAVAKIQREVDDIEHKIETLQGEIALLLDCPELQVFRYDLRSVLMHTGLPGRKEMYSYVQDAEGTWWKTVDYEVTEVTEETVLTDPAGLHLGAGPYMLFYSRHLSEEQIHEPLVWPTIFSEAVEKNNKNLLMAWHPELEIFLRPPTSTYTPPQKLPTVPKDFSTPPPAAATGFGSSWPWSPLPTLLESSNAPPQGLGEQHSLGSLTDAFALTSQMHSFSASFQSGIPKPGNAVPVSAHGPVSYNPHKTAIDIDTISVASSRTASTDYGVHYRRWALSQEMNSLVSDPSRGSWESYRNYF